MRVRTTDWPERAAFLARIDELMKRESYRHDTALAEAAGISHTAISNWRRGKVKPSLVSVAAVAKALNTHPNQLAAAAGLLTEEGEIAAPDPLPDELQQLAALYRLVDDDSREEILKQVRVVLAWVEHTMLPQSTRKAS